ncbi:MAG: GtrA family protein [Lachnospiraceae bacterium]|nr:MAG: GtrA family protein [Lachnospiraceae bacterium]
MENQKNKHSYLHGLIDGSTVRFIIVGLINTLVGSGTMFILYNALHCGYWFSTAMNYVVGSIVSYFLNKYFTFKSNKKSGREIVRFIVNISICYLVAYGLAKPLVKLVLSGAGEKVRGNAAMLVGMVLFVGMNYIGQKFFVFKKDSDSENEGKDSNE